jgi:hypothetical protein
MALVKIFRGFLERERQQKATGNRGDVDEKVLPGMNGPCGACTSSMGDRVSWPD